MAYHNGRGVERDTTEAIPWYLIAAEHGFTVSQIAIGMMCFTGDGVEEDDDEAEECFRVVVEQRDRLPLRIVEMMADYAPEEWEGGEGSRCPVRRRIAGGHLARRQP